MTKLLNTKSLQSLCIFFVVLMPFLFNRSNAESPFELFKLSVSSFYILPLFLAVTFYKLKNESVFNTNKALIWLGLTLMSYGISFLFSINSYLSFWGDNLLPSDSFRSFIIFGLFAVILSQLFFEKTDIKKMIYAFFIVAMFSSLYGFLQIYHLDPAWFSIYKRVYATIGNTSGYSRLLGALSPIVIGIIIVNRSNWVKSIASVVLLLLNICLLATGARIPIAVNGAITAVFLIILFKKYDFKFFIKIAGLIILIGFVAFGFFRFSSTGENLSEKTQIKYINKALDIRMLLFKNGIEVAQKAPIFGYGPETFIVAQRPVQSLEMNKYQSWEFGWHKAHNDLIQILVGRGLFGLIIYLGFFFYLSYKAIRIFLAKEFSENQIYGIAFYFGWLFLFVSNLSAFNFLATQLYVVVFPVLMLAAFENENQKELKIFIPERLRRLVFIFVVIPVIYFFAKSWNYWQADIEHQKSRTAANVKQDLTAAIKLNENAIWLNESEPMYYCHRANLLGKALNRNKNKISGSDQEAILNDIEDNLKNCVHYAINRDYFLFFKAEQYGQLFFDGLITDASKALNSYDELIRLTPVSPKPHLQKGIIYLRNKDSDSFFNEMKTALELKPDYMPAFIELINFYYKAFDQKYVDLLAEKISNIVFYASDQTEYLGDLVIIAEQNKDYKNKEIFKNLVEQYSSFKDIN